MTIRIKNWKKFQHFKDRKPPWIKVYRDILDDPDWHDLDGSSAKSLVMLWLIASEHEGNLPDYRKLAFRLRKNEKDLKQLLNCLSHWLERDDINTISNQYQLDAPETETETETEVEKRRKTGKILLPDDWVPAASHYELAKQKGLSTEAVSEAADEMRSWSLGNGEKRSNWDWVFNNWLRRHAKRRGDNGTGRKSLVDIGKDLADEARELEYQAGLGRPTDRF